MSAPIPTRCYCGSPDGHHDLNICWAAYFRLLNAAGADR